MKCVIQLLVFSLAIGGCAGRPADLNRDSQEQTAECYQPNDADPYLVYSAALSGELPSDEVVTIVLLEDTISLDEGIWGLDAYSYEPSGLHPTVLEASEDMWDRSAEPVRLNADSFFLLHNVDLINKDEIPRGQSPCSGDEWLDFQFEHDDAFGVRLLSAAGYSCDGTRAIFYSEFTCGDIYASGHVYVVSRVGDFWALEFSEQVWHG